MFRPAHYIFIFVFRKGREKNSSLFFSPFHCNQFLFFPFSLEQIPLPTSTLFHCNSRNLLHSAGHSSLFCNDLNGWDRVVGERSTSEVKYTCIELVHFIVQQKVTHNVNSALFVSHIKEGWWAGFEGNCSKLCISGLKPHQPTLELQNFALPFI